MGVAVVLPHVGAEPAAVGDVDALVAGPGAHLGGAGPGGAGRWGTFYIAPTLLSGHTCSILFHFEVPGGKWQTVIASPVSAASAASSLFHTP